MKTFNVKTEYGIYKDCHFVKGNYKANDSVALEIWNEEDGPIATLTVCLPNFPQQKNESFLDINNCPWAENLVKELGIAEFTGQMMPSGYCSYPLYEFDMEKVEEYANV